MGCLATVSSIGAALVLAAAGDAPQGGRALVIGTDESFPPYVQLDETGAVSGFDIDVMNEICTRTGHDCEWQTVAFDELIPGVVSGRFDAAIAGMAITPGRRELVDFTDPYTNGGETEWFVGLPGAPMPEDGVTAVQSGTIHEDWLRHGGYDHRGYSTEIAALGAVASGAADLALGPFNDRPDLVPLIEGQGFLYLYEVEIPDEGTGIAVCKGNTALKAEFDAAIGQLWQDGTLEELENRWFQG
jgi:ABC-type amino acid transport substrate-binding protein